MFRQHLSNKIEFDASYLESGKTYADYFVSTIQYTVGDVYKKENMKAYPRTTGAIKFCLFSMC